MDDCKKSYNSEVIKTESSVRLDKSFNGLGRSVASTYASESLPLLPHAQSLSSSLTLTGLPCMFMLNGLFWLFCIDGLHVVLHSWKISAGSFCWSKSSLIRLQGIDRSFLSSRCCWVVLDPSELAKGMMKEKNDVKDFPPLGYDLTYTFKVITSQITTSQIYNITSIIICESKEKQWKKSKTKFEG